MKQKVGDGVWVWDGRQRERQRETDEMVGGETEEETS